MTMFSSDWYTRNSHWLSVLALLAVLLPTGYFTLLNIGYNEGYKTAQSRNGGVEANYEVYERCFALGAREDVLSCLKAGTVASRAEQRAEEDLQAQRNMSSWGLAIFIAILVVGVLTVFLMAIGVLHVKDALRASTAMHKEAVKARELSQKQLIATQRPWLKMSCNIASPLEYLADGSMRVTVEITVANIGNYPARDIAIFSSFDFTGAEGLYSDSIVEEKTRAAKSMVPLMGRDLLFSGDQLTETRKLSAPRDVIEKDAGYPDYISPSIIVGAAYRFDTSPDVHYSVISRHIGRASRQKIFLDKGNIARDDLVLHELGIRRDQAT